MEGQNHSKLIRGKKSIKCREKDISKEVTLSFKYDDYDSNIIKYIPLVKKNNTRLFSENIDILDQSQYKFILNISDIKNYSKYSNQINSNLQWDDVNTVIYYSSDIYTCPICLEKNLVCPIISICGHIYCWSCIKAYHDYWMNSINKKVPLCPLCKELVDLDNTRFCKFIKSFNYSENHTITFNLIMKDKKAPILYNVFHDPDLEYYKKNIYKTRKDIFSFIPIENQIEFSFSRLFLTSFDLLLNRYECIKKDLINSLLEEESSYSNEARIKTIKNCIKEIEQMINNIKYSEKENENDDIDKSNLTDERENQSTVDDEAKIAEDVKIDYKSFLYFYQEQCGDIYFLHPINYTILLAEYGSEEMLPTDVTGKILEIEVHQVTPLMKNQHTFLNHLKIGSLFYFVEIDVKQLVSNHTLKLFHNILKERAKTRNLIKREEEHYDNYIQNIKIKEEKRLMTEINKYKNNSDFTLKSSENHTQKETNKLDNLWKETKELLENPKT